MPRNQVVSVNRIDLFDLSEFPIGRGQSGDGSAKARITHHALPCTAKVHVGTRYVYAPYMANVMLNHWAMIRSIRTMEYKNLLRT